jgi:hypothetical protein
MVLRMAPKAAAIAVLPSPVIAATASINSCLFIVYPRLEALALPHSAPRANLGFVAPPSCAPIESANPRSKTKIPACLSGLDLSCLTHPRSIGYSSHADGSRRKDRDCSFVNRPIYIFKSKVNERICGCSMQYECYNNTHCRYSYRPLETWSGYQLTSCIEAMSDKPAIINSMPPLRASASNAPKPTQT